jgi:hypothetical protein
MRVGSIVEGHGEVEALPILLRRMHELQKEYVYLEVKRPNRFPRASLLNDDKVLKKALQRSQIDAGNDGWILLLIDADDDCPKTLAETLLNKINKLITHTKISVVIANREYEAWFLAAAASLQGKRGFTMSPTETIEAEKPRDCKGWMGDHLGRSYDPITDQPAFTQVMDLHQAHQNSRSFRKLATEWQRHLT